MDTSKRGNLIRSARHVIPTYVRSETGGFLYYYCKCNTGDKLSANLSEWAMPEVEKQYAEANSVELWVHGLFSIPLAFHESADRYLAETGLTWKTGKIRHIVVGWAIILHRITFMDLVKGNEV